MPDDFRADDPKAIWLTQPTEKPTMTLQLLQQRSRDLHAKTRTKLLATLAGPLTGGFFYAYSMKEFTAHSGELQPFFAFALAWSVAGLYFLNRGMWTPAMPGDAGLSTGLDFCRREIDRQRDLLRRFLVWLFAPILLSIGVFIAALAIVSTRDRGLFPNGLPFLVGVAAWIVGYVISRIREQRQLQREIDELNRIEEEHKGA